MLKSFKTNINRFLDYTPKLYIGPRWLNVLGLQVLRIGWHNLGRRTARAVPPKLQAIVSELERNGTVVLENFFPDAVFTQIKEEFDLAYAEWSKHKLSALESCGWDEKYFQDIEEFVAPYSTPIAKKYLAENDDIRVLVEAITHRKVRRLPEPLFWSIGVKETGVSEEKIKYHNTQYLHSDVVFPSVKVWIYLNNVNEENGAFVYAKGSHSPTSKWALNEYKMSLRPQDSGCITHDYAERAGIFETSLSAPANTVIISNHMGYHRRGEFKLGARRDAVHIDFRYVESLRNRYSWLLAVVRSLRRAGVR